MDGCRFAVNSDMKQYLEEKPGMFTDVEKLTKKDMEEEFFYVGLRMISGVSLPEFERRIRGVREGRLSGAHGNVCGGKSGSISGRPVRSDGLWT